MSRGGFPAWVPGTTPVRALFCVRAGRDGESGVALVGRDIREISLINGRRAISGVRWRSEPGKYQ